jgi:hypothetical protein
MTVLSGMNWIMNIFCDAVMHIGLLEKSVFLKRYKLLYKVLQLLSRLLAFMHSATLLSWVGRYFK